MNGGIVGVLLGAAMLALSVLGFSGRLPHNPARSMTGRYAGSAAFGLTLVLAGVAAMIQGSSEGVATLLRLLAFVSLVFGFWCVLVGVPTWAQPRWQRGAGL